MSLPSAPKMPVPAASLLDPPPPWHWKPYNADFALESSIPDTNETLRSEKCASADVLTAPEPQQPGEAGGPLLFVT